LRTSKGCLPMSPDGSRALTKESFQAMRGEAVRRRRTPETYYCRPRRRVLKGIDFTKYAVRHYYQSWGMNC
jgi:hypothetical protein